MSVRTVPEGGDEIGFIDEESVAGEALVSKVQQVILDDRGEETAGRRDAILAVLISRARG